MQARAHLMRNDDGIHDMRERTLFIDDAHLMSRRELYKKIRNHFDIDGRIRLTHEDKRFLRISLPQSFRAAEKYSINWTTIKRTHIPKFYIIVEFIDDNKGAN